MTPREADVRTQVYLTADQHRTASQLGRRLGRSLASLVREALDEYLRQHRDEAADWSADPAIALIGAFPGPPREQPDEPLNEAIDRELYGEIDWSSQTPLVSSPRGSTTKRTTPKPRKRGARSPSAGRGS